MGASVPPAPVPHRTSAAAAPPPLIVFRASPSEEGEGKEGCDPEDSPAKPLAVIPTGAPAREWDGVGRGVVEESRLGLTYKKPLVLR